MRIWLLAALGACGFSRSLSNVEVHDDAMMMIDGPEIIDAPAGFTCLGATASTNAFEVCVEPSGLAGISLSGTIDTSSDPKCAGPDLAKWTSTSQPAACFIAGTSITFTGDVTATGSRPLVLFATASISVSSRTLHASGDGTSPGTGPQVCGTFQRTPEQKGGGAGGSFMTTGGNGGNNTDDPSLGGIAPAPSTAPVVLQGGCTGQDGGGGNLGGGGGGAVYFVAGTTIDLGSSKIDLSGGGGTGGPDDEGGGGGGSGGMFLMFAGNNIAGGSSRVNANGGGGGGGGGNNSAGGNGQETDPNVPLAGGDGGTATMGGGPGGQGSPSLAVGGATSMDRGAGGGGGGGGYIRANKTFVTTSGISPLPSIIP